MQQADYIAHLTRDGRRMADLARFDLDNRVPTCPDWTVRDLLAHTGNVHRWFARAARELTAGPPEFPSHAPSDGSLAAWLASGVDELASSSQPPPANQSAGTA